MPSRPGGPGGATPGGSGPPAAPKPPWLRSPVKDPPATRAARVGDQTSCSNFRKPPRERPSNLPAADDANLHLVFSFHTIERAGLCHILLGGRAERSGNPMRLFQEATAELLKKPPMA